jgi:hypothetical protein
MEMPPQSSIKFLATAHFCVKLFMLLARNFSDNAVESCFQSLLDLGGAGSAV